MNDAVLVWFRRDLRDFDHAALAAALRSHARVHCAFVFDTDILAPLRQRRLFADRLVDFLHRSLAVREHGRNEAVDPGVDYEMRAMAIRNLSES